MQNADSGASVQPDDRHDRHRAVVSDLALLIEQVQASMKLIEAAIAGEPPVGNEEIAANIVVLDDVTPRYMKANAVLNICNAGLGEALHFLLDTKASKYRPDASAGYDRRPVRLIGRV